MDVEIACFVPDKHLEREVKEWDSATASEPFLSDAEGAPRGCYTPLQGAAAQKLRISSTTPALNPSSRL